MKEVPSAGSQSLARPALGHHRQAAFRAYLTLSIAFLCMMGINLIAYFTIRGMNETFLSQQNASIKIKLNLINSNLMFREVVSGQTKKDMNAVWKAIDQIRVFASRQLSGEAKDELLKKLDDYRQMLLTCYQAYKVEIENVGLPQLSVKIGPDGKPVEEKKTTLASLRDKYNKSFEAVMAQVDQLEALLGNMVATKMFLFKALYALLFVNVLILFWFTFYTFRRYINRSRRAEDELIGARENLTIILNSLESIVFSVDSVGNVTQWSKVAESVFEIPEAEALERKVWELVPFLEAFKEEIVKVFHSKKPFHVQQVRCEKFKGHLFNVNMNFSSGIHAVVIRVDDVTEQETRNEQLRQSQKMEVVENMIGGMAHNFNNVLGAITGTISMLKYSFEHRDLVDDQEISGNIDVIETSAERAVIMIQQLVKLSERHEVKPLPIDLNHSIEHVINICSNTLDKRIELVAEVFDMPAMTHADTSQIEQVLLNLCDNAAQAMTAARGPGEVQGGTLSITIDRVFNNKKFREEHLEAEADTYWEICVADTGKGIEPEIGEKIFDPFFSTKRGEEARSTGLGLTIADDIVHRHQGFIEFESVINEGTKFKIYLPELVEGEMARPGFKPAETALAEGEPGEEVVSAEAPRAILAIQPAAQPAVRPAPAAQPAVQPEPEPEPEPEVEPQPEIEPEPEVEPELEVALEPEEKPKAAPSVEAFRPRTRAPVAPPIQPESEEEDLDATMRLPRFDMAGKDGVKSVPQASPVLLTPAASSPPRVEKSRPTPIPRPAAGTGKIGDIPTGSGTILVVDDEAILRKTAKSILRKLGYQVIFGEDGEDGVNVFREHYREIDLVMLDMAMPKLSGKDAFIEMKKINPEVKAIVVSGFSLNEDIQEALDMGCRGFVEKPYSIVNLAQEIQRAMNA